MQIRLKLPVFQKNCTADLHIALWTVNNAFSDLQTIAVQNRRELTFGQTDAHTQPVERQIFPVYRSRQVRIAQCTASPDGQG